ncbi:hypothetical protein DM860_011707 [Cuscuta australis]|uniref:GB1/RHD3-type G domain-containing protein n=1 Tax=Cuscuta australis TaxID=267555 RepID=A0A328DGR6_9ASTE|nr:hypothetical protein DM860_011707 [Cuscuta australis]
MANNGEDHKFQLIDAKGEFNEDALEKLEDDLEFHECGRSYVVVAILGPKGSGKSTLLNHLFGTQFKTMDASQKRSQEDQGIWMTKCSHIEPLTLVMDLEGSDSSERSDDISFEKRSALFAFSVAHFVLINMWCHDIGREHAANKPLLRTVFQQVLKKFRNEKRKVTLMFVIRDYLNATQLHQSSLEAKLRDDVNEIWLYCADKSQNGYLNLHDYFQVEVIFLPNYEERKADFKTQVEELKTRFITSAYIDLTKPRASMFPFHAQNVWKDILGNKDLDIPKQEIMISVVRCEEIKNELYKSFQMSKELHELRKQAYLQFVADFGGKVGSILDTYVSKYDEESFLFDEAVVKEKREQLIHESLQLVEHIHAQMEVHLRQVSFLKFTEAIERYNNAEDTEGKSEKNRPVIVEDEIQIRLNDFDGGIAALRAENAKWDSSKARAKLIRQMEDYAFAKKEDRPQLIVKSFKSTLKQVFSSYVLYLVSEERDPSWSKIREHFKKVAEPIFSQLDALLEKLGVNEEDRKKTSDKLREDIKNNVIAKVREESWKAKNHLINRYIKHFMYDDDLSPRSWNNPEEIPDLQQAALSPCIQLLAFLAVVCWEEADEDYDFFKTLQFAYLNRNDVRSQEWEKVRPSNTLIKPIKCLELLSEEIEAEVEKTKKWASELAQASKARAKSMVDRLIPEHPETTNTQDHPSSKTLVTHIKCTELMKEGIVEVGKKLNHAIEAIKSKTMILIKEYPFLVGAILAIMLAIWGAQRSNPTHMLE